MLPLGCNGSRLVSASIWVITGWCWPIRGGPLGEEWANTTALGAYDPDAIRRLKRDRDGVIYISGSGQLVRALLSEGLVDELHLFVYPLALGEGERFWGEGGGPTRLALKAQDVYDNGVVHQAYGPA